VFRRNQTGVTDLDFSCNGRSIVSALGGDAVRIWNVRDGSSKVLKEENIVDWPMYMCAKFSPNGRLVAAANKDGFLRIWDSRTRQLVGKWHGHKNVVSSLVFMPDGKGLLSGGLGSAVKYWHVSTIGGKETGFTIGDTLTWFEGHTVRHSIRVSSLDLFMQFYHCRVGSRPSPSHLMVNGSCLVQMTKLLVSGIFLMAHNKAYYRAIQIEFYQLI
jgi:WD40 repeat protein